MESPNKGLLESQFNAYYEQHFHQIHRYIYRLIGNIEEAEQLAQQAFAGFFTHLLSSPKMDDVRPLLFRIATNASLNYINKHRKTKEALNKMPLPDTANDDPLEQTIIRQQKSLIQNGLAQLKPRDRECVLLYTEGLSYSEIAHVIGAKRTTVGKILSRAIERLTLQVRKGDGQ